nr:MAG TPA: hypothetical protein [Caudoviricetes sp.]
MLKPVKQQSISRLFFILAYKRTKVKTVKICYTLKCIKAAWLSWLSSLYP